MTNPGAYLHPLFVGGCDRSGTTLLGATLARFPGIVALPESQFLYETGRLWTEKNAPLEELAEFISTHLRFSAWRDAGCAPPRNHLNGVGDYRAFIDSIVRDYARATGVKTPTAFVDHSPGNSRNIRVLKSVFPDLKFAHIIRDGRAVAASLMPQDWGPNDVLEAAQVWELNVAAGFAACDYLGAAAVNLRFEGLVAETETTLAAIAALAGASSFSAAASHSSYCRPSYAKSTHALVNAKPAPGRAGAWRQTLSLREIELFEHAAGPLLESLGYGLVYPRGAARKASRTERGAIIVKRWLSYRRNQQRFHTRFST